MILPFNKAPQATVRALTNQILGPRFNNFPHFDSEQIFVDYLIRGRHSLKCTIIPPLNPV